MIPPFLAAAIAKPGIKWGILGGAVAILLGLTNWWTYDTMRTKCEESKLEAMAVQAQAVSRQAFHGAALAAKSAGDTDRQLNEFHRQVTELERKGQANAKRAKPCTLDPNIVQQFDEYVRVLNSTARDLPTSDGGSSESEIPRGGVGASPAQVVSVEIGGESLELTPEQLNRFVADVTRKYGAMKVKYRRLSEFDDQRVEIGSEPFKEEP